ncbi:hypothetical protein M0638_28020 [Roseomonas sp. NAR14]|uniref:Uncharacterized protein n=1 Tax=Roseomonas acroporae TaxID=2937791 RepID=A0A9X2BYA9_9PROT|nr:hypothetical protein [Roseomonas acroporae]MCK8788201.1 hypothetical protein [Roseomonas acroporae]
MAISIHTGLPRAPEEIAENNAWLEARGLKSAPPPKRKRTSKPRTAKPTKAQLAAQAKRQAAWRER